MNKLEATVSLFIITFFAAIQYAFLSGVPESVSHFAFLCITNLIGLVLTLLVLGKELFRLDRKQILQGLVLSAELFGFNTFFLLGSSGAGATASACVLSAYFVFIPLLSFLAFKEKPKANCLIGIGAVLVGLFFILGLDFSELWNIHILWLVIADVFFAAYILTVDRFTRGSNPSILAIGQLAFNFLFALIAWAVESVILKKPFSLPSEASFWGSVIFISFFIRSLYSVVQIYAQRYVKPLTTSLIFSTEIVMTMLMSPVLSYLFGTEAETFTWYKLVGSVLMILGILIADSAVTSALTGSRIQHRRPVRQVIQYTLIAAIIYVLVDLPVQATHFLTFSSYIGIKCFLPSTLGLLLGPYGAIGSCIGIAVTACFMGNPLNECVFEALCTLIIGLGMWLAWHFRNDSHKINFKIPQNFLRFFIPLILLSALCGVISFVFVPGGDFIAVLAAYTLLGALIGIPANILFSGIFCQETILPPWYNRTHDLERILTKDTATLDNLNDALEDLAMLRKIGTKRLFELQNCIEEVSIRIFAGCPEAQIRSVIDCDDTISIYFKYIGKKYNPLLAVSGEDAMDLISLTLIKHRALQAAFSYRVKNSENTVHIVI